VPATLHTAVTPASEAVAAERLRARILGFYEVAAGHYDGWAAGVNARAAKRLAEIVGLRPGGSALDVGCGTGLVTHQLSLDAPGGFVFGIDISPHMLAVAHANRPSGSAAVFAIMPAESLLMRSDSFEVVTLGQTLPYLFDPAPVLAEAFRVLRPGGRIVVSCQRRKLSTAVENVFFTELARLAERLPFEIVRPPREHAWLGEPEVLKRRLAESGFVDVSTTQLVTGNHTTDAAGWIELMMFAGPYPHEVLAHLGAGPRSAFLKRFQHAAGQLSADPFRYHRAFTFGSARRP
jgi:ubiquinone/menaquinone biosynthesis C-methylase UbiE